LEIIQDGGAIVKNIAPLDGNNPAKHSKLYTPSTWIVKKEEEPLQSKQSSI
jgi:hypothetical protein